MRFHRHLTYAAQDWAALGRDAPELYRGPRLATALDWEDGVGESALNPLEHEFLTASRARQEEETREHVAQLRRLRRLLAGARLALVNALVAGSLAVVQRRRADDEARAARDATLRADVGRLVAESDALLDRDRYLATILALEANRHADTGATRNALLNALVAEPRLQATMSAGHRDYFATVYIPPGRLVAARSFDVLDFFDTRTGRQSGPSIDIDPGAGLAASPDGTLVATGSRDGEVTLWNVATRERQGTPLRLGHPSGIPAFSPDGRLLVTPAGGYGVTSPISRSALSPPCEVRAQVCRLFRQAHRHVHTSPAAIAAVMAPVTVGTWAATSTMPPYAPSASSSSTSPSSCPTAVRMLLFCRARATQPASRETARCDQC